VMHDLLLKSIMMQSLAKHGPKHGQPGRRPALKDGLDLMT